MTTLREKAIKLAWLLNDEGHKPSEALAMLGFEEDDYYSEDDSILDIDDADNDVIDLSWEDGESVILRREYRLSDGAKVWDVRVSRYLTNYHEDPDFKEATDGPVLPDPPAHLADAWQRYQEGGGGGVTPPELRALDEWRGEVAEAMGL